MSQAGVLSRCAVRMLSVVATLCVAAATSATNAAEERPAADRECIECHASPRAAAAAASSPGMTPADAVAAAPQMNAAAFAHSVHADVGCNGCHENVMLPAKGRRAGPAHDPGTLQPGPKQACRGCHEKVFKALDRSIHAQARREGKRGTPGCVSCHAAHEVTAASVQDGPKNVCLSCHDDPALTHQSWLPNAARHLQTVSCAACHAPDALRRVELRLVVTPAAAGAAPPASRFEAMAEAADANRDGLDAREFRSLFDALEQGGAKVTVQGRIELRGGVQAHALPEKSRALRDCFGCHDEDAAPYKNVTVSMLDANGAPLRYDAHHEILTSALTARALKGFYALGGTRLETLDLLLALGLAAGVSVPALHLAARRLLRRDAAPGAQSPAGSAGAPQTKDPAA